jgi:hypothetical protein
LNYTGYFEVMTKRMAFTPTDAQLDFIDAYRKTYELEKPQDVLHVALALLEEEELVLSYDRLAAQAQGAGQPEPGEESEAFEAETRPYKAASSSAYGGT